MKDPHLISVDELRAAGALDVPASWRKSLAGERDQLTLFRDDDGFAEKQEPALSDTDADAPADELP